MIADEEKIEQKIDKIKAQLKEEEQKLKRTKQLKKEKLIKQVGKKVIDKTGIKSLDNLSDFEIVRKGEFQSEKNTGISEDNLKKMANELIIKNNNWTLPESQKFFNWLAKYRTDNQRSN